MAQYCAAMIIDTNPRLKSTLRPDSLFDLVVFYFNDCLTRLYIEESARPGHYSIYIATRLRSLEYCRG